MGGHIKQDRLERLYRKHAAWVYNGGAIRRVIDCRTHLGLSDHASRHLVRTVKQRMGERKSPAEPQAPTGEKPPEMSSDTFWEKTVGYCAAEVKSIAELCEHFGLDPNEWEFETVKVNQWEGFYKNDEGTATKVPLRQVKTTLRRKLAAEWRRPVIDEPLHRQPVDVGDIETVLFIPDIQFGWYWSEDYRSLYPMHDPVALDIVLQVVEDMQPDMVCIIGDAADLAPWSTRWTAHPLVKRTTQPTIDALFWYFRQLRLAAPSAHIKFLVGNHDIRPETAIIERLPELLGLRTPGDDMPLMAIERIYGLDQLDIEVVAGGDYDKGFWLWPESVSPVLVRHGEGSPKDMSKEVKSRSYSVVQGHVHKVQQASRTIYEPTGGKRIITAMTPGCLCRTGGHVPGFKRSGREDWQHGLGFASLHDGSPTVWSVPFQGDTVCMGPGKVYTGQDLTPAMAEGTGWEQMTLNEE